MFDKIIFHDLDRFLAINFADLRDTSLAMYVAKLLFQLQNCHSIQ